MSEENEKKKVTIAIVGGEGTHVKKTIREILNSNEDIEVVVIPDEKRLEEYISKVDKICDLLPDSDDEKEE